MSISVVLIIKNASKTIERVLQSLAFAQEIIVVDIQSTDDSVKLARKYTKHVSDFGQDSRFVEPVRNFALAKATQDWVLVLDGDEEVPETLAKKLVALAAEKQNAVFWLPRKNMVSGYWMQHTGWWPDYQLRFFPRGIVSWSKQIHAKPIIADDVKVEFLEAEPSYALLHHNYANTHDYLDRFNRYTDIEAEQKLENATEFAISPSTLLQAFSGDLMRRLFSERGYKDGVRGLYLSVMQAAYQMTVQMKLFDLLGNKEQLEKQQTKELIGDLRRFQKELHYWINDMRAHESRGLLRLIARLRRKIGL